MRFPTMGGLCALVLVMALSAACSKAKVNPGAPYLYTKYNISTQFRGEQTYVASFRNWIDPGHAHVIFPPNTKVQQGLWKKGANPHRGFVLKAGEKLIYFDYDSKAMDGMSKDEYVKLITSPGKVSLSGYSALDKEGIEKGKALPGMTRQGVVCALGYPAKDKTPSLDANRWVYWTDRYATISVYFKDGKVERVQGGQ